MWIVLLIQSIQKVEAMYDEARPTEYTATVIFLLPDEKVFEYKNAPVFYSITHDQMLVYAPTDLFCVASLPVWNIGRCRLHSHVYIFWDDNVIEFRIKDQKEFLFQSPKEGWCVRNFIVLSDED